MVGTHVPDDRDRYQSALQRMREAFEGLHDGTLPPGLAQDTFLAAYDEVADLSSAWFLNLRPGQRP